MQEQYPGLDPLDAQKDGDWEPFDEERGISPMHSDDTLYDSMQNSDGSIYNPDGTKKGHDDWDELTEAPGGWTIIE